MKITVSARAAASALDSDEEVTDPKILQKLDGLDFCTDKVAQYLSQPLLDIGIVGGRVGLAYDAKAKELRVVVEYHAPRSLKPAELEKLVAETKGQWSDGVGEGEFRYRKKLKLDIDLSPANQGKVATDQTDDGKVVKAPPKPAELLKVLAERKFAEAAKLVAAGADVNCKDKNGYTPLHQACLAGAADLALALLERGAAVNVTSKRGGSPLAALAKAELPKSQAKRLAKVAEELIRRGAKVDAADKEGITPLMWAACRNNPGVFDVLVDAGADVNAQDNVKYNKFTVLMYAQSTPMIEKLLSAGADPSARNELGMNAADYAFENDHIAGYKQRAALLQAHIDAKK